MEESVGRKWSHTAAFKHFGTKPRNVQWSWSARSDDGSTVVVTLWQHEFKRRNGATTYERAPFDPNEPDTRPGLRELMDNLAWARDHCDGRFNVIIAKAKNKDTHPKSIEYCFPSELTMRLTSLDVARGSFAAEVERSSDVTRASSGSASPS